MIFWIAAFMAISRMSSVHTTAVNGAHTTAMTEGEADASPASETAARMNKGVMGGFRE